MKHKLKTDSEGFRAVWRGIKKCEIRFNDRDYQIGHDLVLMETRHTCEEMKLGHPLIYTGSVIIARVTHLLVGPAYGLAKGWAIMSIDVHYMHRPSTPNHSEGAVPC